MADIYELSKFQYDSLVRMANKEHQLLMAVEPVEADDEETKNRLTKQLDEAHDLVSLGLAEDKTGSLVEMVTAAKMKAGRGMEVYIITQMGFDMFYGVQRRPN